MNEFEKKNLISDHFFVHSFLNLANLLIRIYRNDVTLPGAKTFGKKKFIDEYNLSRLNTILNKPELKDFLPNFKAQKPIKQYTWEHKILGTVNVEVYEGTLDGESYEWHMAHSHEHVWIDRIHAKSPLTYSMTSYGVPAKYSYFGFLTCPPIVKKDETEELANFCDDLKENKTSTYRHTDLLLEALPPVIAYAQAKAIDLFTEERKHAFAQQKAKAGPSQN